LRNVNMMTKIFDLGQFYISSVWLNS
jgi:hypothetical protein